MAYAYVYAPFNGQNWGQDTYCFDGSPHPTEVYCCPIDIGRPNNDVTSIYFHGSSNIKSIRISHYNDICGPSPWRDGVIVELYGQLNAQCYIGAVFYGHVNNRIDEGVYNANSIKIGDACPDNCNCNQNGLCSSGVHVHMERSGGYSNSFGCYDPIYAGSTWIYRWAAAC